MNIQRIYKNASLKIKVIALLILVAIGYFGYNQFFKAKTTATQYQTESAEKKTLINTVSVTGNIASTNLVSVGSTTTGVIEEVYVKNGDTVKSGDKLFKVKSTATPDDIASAYAAYLSASNSVKTAELSKNSNDVSMWKARDALLKAEDDYTYKNSNSTNRATNKEYTALEKQLIDSAYIQAQKEWTAAQEKYNQSDTSITVSRAQLNSAWIDYQKTQTATITASIPGTVANLSAKVGDYITATTSSNSASTTTTSTPILYIGNLASAVIKASVNEADLPKIKVEQKSTITLTAFPEKTFAGEVSHIDSIGTNSSGVVTYNIYIKLVSVPEGVAPGMSASANIQTLRIDDVISVPTSAVQTTNGVSSVQILKADKTVENRTVQTGTSTDTQIEIKSGLTEGEQIITGSTSTSTTPAQTGTSPFSGGFGSRTGTGSTQQIRIAR
jgi:RND family efflux transporter MFP subunit